MKASDRNVLRATLFSNVLQAKQKWTLSKTNMSASFFAGFWQELLSLPSSQSAIHGPAVSVCCLPKASSSGLHRPPDKPDILAREGAQTHHALGGRLPAPPGPGGWSILSPEPSSEPGHKHTPGSPTQEAARAAGKVEGLLVIPGPAEDRQPDLEPEPNSEPGPATVVWVPYKELCPGSSRACWVQVSPQTVAASEGSHSGTPGVLGVLLHVQQSHWKKNVQVCVHRQHLELEAVGSFDGQNPNFH